MIRHAVLPVATLVLLFTADTAFAQALPKLDPGPICRAGEKATPGTLQACMADEKRAHDDLARLWPTIAPEYRTKCVRTETSIAGFQSYVELLTCIQMYLDVKTLPKP